MLLVDVNKKVNNKNFTPKVNIDQLSRASLSYFIYCFEKQASFYYEIAFEMINSLLRVDQSKCNVINMISWSAWAHGAVMHNQSGAHATQKTCFVDAEISTKYPLLRIN